MTLYSPSGGKNIRHGWIAVSNDIGAISYVVVQTYEPAFNGFDALHGARRPLATFSFAHLSSDAILVCIPDNEWTLEPGGRHIALTLPAQQVFNELLRSQKEVLAATRELARRRRKEK
jgi:hypothetical protein